MGEVYTGSMRNLVLVLSLFLGASGLWFYLSVLKAKPEREPPPPSFAERFDEALGELKTTDLRAGKGPAAKRGSRVSVSYETRLPDGTQVHSNSKKDRPVTFELGMAQALPAWDHGIIGMKAGGKRRIESPPFLAYGEFGVEGMVPPNSRVIFEIELLKVEAEKSKSNKVAHSKSRNRSESR